MPRAEPAKASTRNVTVMFTDIKGFTARVSGGSRTEIANLRAAHDKLLVPVFRHFNGTIVKTIGDAFLVRFDSPTDAVLCGVTLQEVLRQHNAFAKDEKDRFDVRVSINTGDVDLSENDVLGEPVNIAYRLESIAEPGDVYFTEAVYLSMNRKEAPAASVGEHTFKGIPYPIRVYKVASGPDSELGKRLRDGVRLTERGPVIKGIEPLSPRPRRLKWFTIGAITATILIIVLFFVLQPDAVERARMNAEAALAKGDAAGAMAIVMPQMQANPENAALADLAVRSAGAQLEKLRAVSYEKALQWLREQLSQYPQLEALRRHEGVLEAQVLATSFIGTNEDAWAPLTALSNRYPGDPHVPFAAAEVLKGKVVPYTTLQLYELALKRGYDGPKQTIIDYCFDLFTRHHPGNVLIAHLILKDYFSKDRHTWASRTLEQSASGVELFNAMKIYADDQDPVATAPWTLALRDIMNGYEDEAAADAALAYLRVNTPEAQRQRVLDLHAWVLNPPVRSWGWKNKPLIGRNLDALEQAWNLTANKPASPSP